MTKTLAYGRWKCGPVCVKSEMRIAGRRGGSEEAEATRGPDAGAVEEVEDEEVERGVSKRTMRGGGRDVLTEAGPMAVDVLAAWLTRASTFGTGRLVAEGVKVGTARSAGVTEMAGRTGGPEEATVGLETLVFITTGATQVISSSDGSPSKEKATRRRGDLPSFISLADSAALTNPVCDPAATGVKVTAAGWDPGTTAFVMCVVA